MSAMSILECFEVKSYLHFTILESMNVNHPVSIVNRSNNENDCDKSEIKTNKEIMVSFSFYFFFLLIFTI